MAPKRLREYKLDHRNKTYTEGVIHVTLDMKENEPMRYFTVQDQIEHVLGVVMTQVYSLEKGLTDSGQEIKMLHTLNFSSSTNGKGIFQWTQGN